LESHHAKTIALVVATIMSTLFFFIANDQRKFPIDHMDSLWQIAMAMFLVWTLSKRAFYLNEDVKPPLIRDVKIACFVTNFALVFSLFTSDKECTTFDSSFFFASASFANPTRFGMTFFTMGSSITFLHHKPVYEDAWKSSKGFSID
jgi:hypothetical protein